MYTTRHIFMVLPINNLVDQDGEPITPHKLSTGTKPSVSNITIFFHVLYKNQLHMFTLRR